MPVYERGIENVVKARDKERDGGGERERTRAKDFGFPVYLFFLLGGGFLPRLPTSLLIETRFVESPLHQLIIFCA